MHIKVQGVNGSPGVTQDTGYKVNASPVHPSDVLSIVYPLCVHDFVQSTRLGQLVVDFHRPSSDHIKLQFTPTLFYVHKAKCKNQFEHILLHFVQFVSSTICAAQVQGWLHLSGLYQCAETRWSYTKRAVYACICVYTHTHNMPHMYEFTFGPK